MNFFIVICFAVSLLEAYDVKATKCVTPTQLSGMISYSYGYETTPSYISYTTPRYNWFTGYDYTRIYGSTRRYDYTTYDYTRNYNDYTSRCWFIRAPEDHYVRLSMVENRLIDPYCDYVFIEVEDNAGFKTKICQSNYNKMEWSQIFLGNVNITLKVRNNYWRRNDLSFKMQYNVENTACARKDSFRCSESQCIYSSQVCDGKEDCADGSDENNCEIPAVSGVNGTRNYAINWLKRRQTDAGWGRNTHRAITALYLAGANRFRGTRTEEELMVKELQLKAVTALLRNTTSLLSVNELSMYVNSLTVTCHDLRDFYGYDLLKIFSGRTLSSVSPSPGAYLALCNAGFRMPNSSVSDLIKLLQIEDYPFALDIQAMAAMALSCIRRNTKFNETSQSIYNHSVLRFMKSQRSDGSFGNPHTTAIVTQAIMARGEKKSSHWNFDSAVKYLMKTVNSSSVDFLTVYLSLPIFNGKTLLDISSVNCSDFQRKFKNDDDDVSEVVDTLGGNTSVQYSLYIGNNKDVVQTIYLKVPENSTALDVMKLAQIADHKFRFASSRMKDRIYIYQIGGISNDIEVGKFWLLFKGHSNQKGQLQKLYTTSPDEIVVNSGDHFIMWYKMADI